MAVRALRSACVPARGLWRFRWVRRQRRARNAGWRAGGLLILDLLSPLYLSPFLFGSSRRTRRADGDSVRARSARAARRAWRHCGAWRGKTAARILRDRFDGDDNDTLFLFLLYMYVCLSVCLFARQGCDSDHVMVFRQIRDVSGMSCWDD